MNILIVGNGFDLSHYLPTKYDHFMQAMSNIEQNSFPGGIGFDELFSELLDADDFFINKTKEKYKVELVLISKEQIDELRLQLQRNTWFRYFKNHIENVDTWIDFENRIEAVLNSFADFLNQISGKQNLNINRSLDNLKWFELFIDKSEIRNFSNGLNEGVTTKRAVKTIVNPKFCFRQNDQNDFDSSSFINYLQMELDDLIQVFNLYLGLVVDKLEPKEKFKIESNSWVQPDHIFSFNYTNTFQKNYTSTNIEFLHGRFGEKQNIVLGVSDLEDGLLKKLKAYGFTKYHQKLFKDTDYLFLDSSTKVFHEIKQGRTLIDEKPKFFNFYVWGHSLDISDQEYIKDLFLFNEPKDQFVRITVFHFNNSAKFSLLNNLLAILGKDKVELWMKKGWLKFEENPKINFGI